MLVLSQKVNQWYNNNQFRVISIYGQSGIGKSVYAWKVLQEVYPDEDVKKYLIFKPEELISFVEDLRKRKERIKTFLIDDAGVWFSAEEYRDPFVMAALKFIQVARSITGSIMFTTTSLFNLVSRLRTLDMYTVRITQDRNMRIAKGYAQSVMPNKRTFIRGVWQDRYHPILDNDLYAWYKGVRDSYVDEANRMMKKGLEMKKYGVRRKV